MFNQKKVPVLMLKNLDSGKIRIKYYSKKRIMKIRIEAELLEEVAEHHELTLSEQFELANCRVILLGYELAKKYNPSKFKTIYDMN